ncbi:hypothetical protein H8S37_04700 [Mediterraneibacter sp. NSJ-55]|uniref:Uncharacterized protein n=1 Tax=Mediterraneibacter hominis TaxID=2763054 RepID=A0A923LGC2_9FIRM|nr:hypothetical protein [Mediterraneibacter hominis]MBC5688228.1 hypothetical protein [Mediterraneibacter hominis]
MLSNDEIAAIYTQFINDLDIKSKMPEIIPMPRLKMQYLAQVKQITSDIYEIALGSKFYNPKINKKYIISNLYHEFTHVYDQTVLLTDIYDKQEKTNILYPYTEYHAAQIQIKKLLELFHNPNKNITKSTTIYNENGIITLKEFIQIQNEQFNLRLEHARRINSKQNFHLLMYWIVYNIGFYSIYNQYNIFEDLFIFHLPFTYVQDDMCALIDLLISTEPSDAFCYESNNMINKISSSIYSNELK